MESDALIITHKIHVVCMNHTKSYAHANNKVEFSYQVSRPEQLRWGSWDSMQYPVVGIK